MELVANRSVVEHGAAPRPRQPPQPTRRTRCSCCAPRPQWRGEPEFSFEDKDRQIAVTVAPCATVLAVLDALAADRRDGQYLVVLTPCDTREVGDSVLALAMHPEIKPVDRWDLVKDAFGARQPRPGAHEEGQPLGRRGAARRAARRRLAAAAGTVLSRASALNRLAATRLGIEDADDSPVDAAALLQWTADRAAVETFLRLREDERDRAYRLAGGDHGRRRRRGLRDGRDRQDLRRRPLRPGRRRAVRAAGPCAGRAPRTGERNGRGGRRPRPRGGALPRRHVP